MKNYGTEQEKFWAGDFGAEYIKRNQDDDLLASKLRIFSRVLEKTNNINSVIELGSNIGLNLKAISTLLPKLNNFSAVEINSNACEELKKQKFITNIYEESLLEFSGGGTA